MINTFKNVNYIKKIISASHLHLAKVQVNSRHWVINLSTERKFTQTELVEIVVSLYLLFHYSNLLVEYLALQSLLAAHKDETFLVV